jgi:membrane protein
VLAASVAYYALVSLLPLALLALVAASLGGGEQFATLVVRRLESALSSSGEEVVNRALTNTRGRVGASVGGVAVLVWSALRLFRGLDFAFAEAYDAVDEPSLLRQLIDAAITLALLAVLGAVAVGVTSAGGLTSPTARPVLL